MRLARSRSLIAAVLIACLPTLCFAADVPGDRPILLKIEDGYVNVRTKAGGRVLEVPSGYYMTELGFKVADVELRRLQEENDDMRYKRVPWLGVVAACFIAAGFGYILAAPN